MPLYPGLQQKIDVIRKKFPFDAGDVAGGIGKDKSTAWRWLRSADALDEEQQRRLVDAICGKIWVGDRKLTEEMFWENDLPTFCCDYLGLTKLEAAIFLDRGLPVPEIFVDSVFQPDANAKNLVGSYLLFRHDKEKTHSALPYLQAYAEIKRTRYGLYLFEDYWEGDGEHSAQAYEGYVIIAGQAMNIIGQRRRVDPDKSPQIFWQGLRRIADDRGVVQKMYGYVSDFAFEELVMADRMVLVRVDKKEVDRVSKQKEYYVDQRRVVSVAGEKLCKYLDDWANVEYEDPYPRTPVAVLSHTQG